MRLIAVLIIALPLSAADQITAVTATELVYWKARALNAEAAYNNCSSQTAQQRYQAEQAAKAMQDVQAASAALDKACTARGGTPKRLEATNEPACEDKKPEAKKSDAGKPATAAK